jgi:DNA-binding response OmpR family regulator
MEHSLTVLVVESNASARERVRAALEAQYAVHFVGGLSEALSAVAERQPDVVVSEVDLGDGTGFELCERLRRQPELRRLPILMLSHRGSTADKVAAFQSGADDYVVKPLDSRLFAARLRLLSRIKSIEPPVLLGE